MTVGWLSRCWLKAVAAAAVVKINPRRLIHTTPLLHLLSLNFHSELQQRDDVFRIPARVRFCNRHVRPNNHAVVLNCRYFELQTTRDGAGLLSRRVTLFNVASPTYGFWFFAIKILKEKFWPRFIQKFEIPECIYFWFHKCNAFSITRSVMNNWTSRKCVKKKHTHLLSL